MEKIGRGSFWKVYRGKLSDSRCAVKRLKGIKNYGDQEGLVSKILNEFDIWSSLNHPNIIRVYGIYHEDDSIIPLLILELMDKSLVDHLYSTSDPFYKKSLFPLQSKISILAQVTGALDYLNSHKNVVHGDLTANNVLLKEISPGVFTSKLTDFGMSRALNDQQTVMSTFQGTYSYMPPEVQNAGEVTTKVDIYSFGVLCVHVLSHKFPKPLHALSIDELGSCAVMSEFNRYRHFLMELADDERLLEPLIEKCLQYKPEERPDPQVVMSRLEFVQETLNSNATEAATQDQPTTVVHHHYNGPVVSGCTISDSNVNVATVPDSRVLSSYIADISQIPADPSLDTFLEIAPVCHPPSMHETPTQLEVVP